MSWWYIDTRQPDVIIHEVIGKGAFATVYKGTLGGITPVAVKKIQSNADRSIFVHEVALMKVSKISSYLQNDDVIIVPAQPQYSPDDV